MQILECCYAGSVKKGFIPECHLPAEYVIWNGKEPPYDNKVYSCEAHVGCLLEESDVPNQVYPIEWGI